MVSGCGADRAVKLWYDPEGDYLEVLFDEEKAGYFRATTGDRVMAKVGHADDVVLGFSILGVRSCGRGFVEVILP